MSIFPIETSSSNLPEAAQKYFSIQAALKDASFDLEQCQEVLPELPIGFVRSKAVSESPPPNKRLRLGKSSLDT